MTRPKTCSCRSPECPECIEASGRAWLAKLQSSKLQTMRSPCVWFINLGQKPAKKYSDCKDQRWIPRCVHYLDLLGATNSRLYAACYDFWFPECLTIRLLVDCEHPKETREPLRVFFRRFTHLQASPMQVNAPEHIEVLLEPVLNVWRPRQLWSLRGHPVLCARGIGTDGPSE